MPQVPSEVKWKAALGRDYTHGNDVQALIDGEAAFQAIYEAIETTKGRSHFIYLLAWWLDVERMLVKDRDDTKLKALFEKKAKAGVQIRVMVWGNPGKGGKAHDTPEQIKELVDTGQNLDDYIAKLARDPDALSKGNPQSHGPIVKWINTLSGAAAIVDWLTAHVLGSHHQKLLCVRGDKGLIATCGGVDVNSDRVKVVNPGKGEPLHDVHCVVRGPAAADLLQVFVQRWDGHPDSKKLDDAKGHFLGRDVPSEDKKDAPGQVVRVATTYNAVPVGAPGLKTESSDYIRRNACKLERSTSEGLLGAIRSASRFIYLEDQYLVSMTIADALRAVLPKLQHVTALITASQISDLLQVWSRRKAFIERVDPLGAQFRVYYLWDPRTRSFGNHTYVHAKTWIFDDELAYIGSANVNRTAKSESSSPTSDGPQSLLTASPTISECDSGANTWVLR
jgi:phosphatidylserine/phosphatidylglycerophosphate/cardiolipin synthase-like enzyme